MSFKEAMRRVITGDDADGKSVIVIDGGPSSATGQPDIGGLFEIWEDAASGLLDPSRRKPDIATPADQRISRARRVKTGPCPLRVKV